MVYVGSAIAEGFATLLKPESDKVETAMNSNDTDSAPIGHERAQSSADEGGAPEPLMIVPVPALCVVLLSLENSLQRPLSEAEVLDALDKAACIAMPLSVWRQVEESRGYRDLDPENVWVEWQSLRPSLFGDSGEIETSQD